MDRHVASLLAMTNKKRFIGLTTEQLGVRLGSRNDNGRCANIDPNRSCLGRFFPRQISRERTQRAQRWVRFYALFAILCGQLRLVAASGRGLK
jgi:hypothetical protein